MNIMEKVEKISNDEMILSLVLCSPQGSQECRNLYEQQLEGMFVL